MDTSSLLSTTPPTSFLQRHIHYDDFVRNFGTNDDTPMEKYVTYVNDAHADNHYDHCTDRDHYNDNYSLVTIIGFPHF